MILMTIDPSPWPNPPLQILDAEITALPAWVSGPAPAWVHAVIRAWSFSLVPIVSGWSRQEEAWRYEAAFELDGIEWCWRDDGDGIWTLVHVMGLFVEPS